MRVREAYLSVDMLVNKSRCATNTGVCGPCQTQSTAGCSGGDTTCFIRQLGVKSASTQGGLNVTVTETAQYIDTQKVNVTATELGYTGASASSYTSSTSQVSTRSFFFF